MSPQPTQCTRCGTPLITLYETNLVLIVLARHRTF